MRKQDKLFIIKKINENLNKSLLKEDVNPISNVLQRLKSDISQGYKLAKMKRENATDECSSKYFEGVQLAFETVMNKIDDIDYDDDGMTDDQFHGETHGY